MKRALCAVGSPEAAREIDAEPEHARIALTPIQRRFVAQRMPIPEHYNQALVLRAQAGHVLEPALLAAALRRVAERHDALRLRYVQDAAGELTQHYAAVGSWPLTVLGEGSFSAACEQAQRSLDLQHGPVARAVLDVGTQRLLLVAHHLVVDAVSWRVLIEDIALAYAQSELPARTHAFRSWSELLQRYAQSPELASELPFWLSQLEAADLPCDAPHGSI